MDQNVVQVNGVIQLEVEIAKLVQMPIHVVLCRQVHVPRDIQEILLAVHAQSVLLELTRPRLAMILHVPLVMQTRRIALRNLLLASSPAPVLADTLLQMPELPV